MGGFDRDSSVEGKTNGRLLSRQKHTFEPHRMREIYALAKVLLDFIEGFFRMEF
jgi:hypothetical protein